jgi:tRNA A37 threonylcarbamoyladenosine synthetase subunit TsaC/SUA5/YrdC
VQKLFEFIDFPLISTSANLSGEKYNGNFERIYQIFKDKVDIFVNNGNRDGEPSTIVKVENSRVKIIRKGKINTI